ncbi:MAG: hypothetical protein JNM27_16930 [Leptospirales bacterium]|nr:hypothetical protein [Leptospirales bacterium]
MKSGFSAVLGRFEVWIVAASSFFFYFFLLSQGDSLPDGDAYFHIKIADLMLQQGFVGKLPWMAESIHASRYVDYHFLFHAFLVPFAFIFSDLILAAKLATAFAGAFSCAMFALLLKRRDVKYRWFWILAYLLISPVFTGRLLFGRGATLFLGLVFLFIDAFELNKRGLAALLMGLSVWLYPGFPVLLMFVFLRFISGGLQGEWRIRSLVIVSSAALVAFLVHPSFPAQFYGYWLEFVVHTVRPLELEAIGEWLAPDREILILGAGPLALLLLRRILYPVQRLPLSYAALAMALLILFVLPASLKPIEYLIPFALLFLAMEFETSSARRVLGAALVLFMLVFSLPQLVVRMRQQLQVANPAEEFEAADWLLANTPHGTMILLSWGEFPRFFFRNTENRYPFGLNPVYAYGNNKQRYLLIRAFFESSARDFYEVPRMLGSEYAVVNLAEHERTAALLLQMPQKARLVFRNQKYFIFKFNP